jgi:hypothetical protein
MKSRSQSSFTPFGLSKGFPTLVHMESYLDYGLHSDLSQDLIKAMGMSPRSHGWRV